MLTIFRRGRRYRLHRCLGYLRRFARRFALEVAPIDAETGTRSVRSVEELRRLSARLDAAIERSYARYVGSTLPSLRERWGALDGGVRARLRAWRRRYADLLQAYIEFRRSRYVDLLGPAPHEVPMPLPPDPPDAILAADVEPAAPSITPGLNPAEWRNRQTLRS